MASFDVTLAFDAPDESYVRRAVNALIEATEAPDSRITATVTAAHKHPEGIQGGSNAHSRDVVTRVVTHLITQHEQSGMPHPIPYLIAAPDATGAKAIFEHNNGCFAYTSDPDDAFLLAVFCSKILSHSDSRARFRDFARAHFDGEPHTYMATLGANPDPGIDLEAVQNWFHEHLPTRLPP